MLDSFDSHYWIVAVGFFGGVLLGLAARCGRFCTMGAIEDALYAEDWTRARMWASAACLVAMAVAILALSGLFDYQSTLYANTFNSLTSYVLGGLLFGLGMALSGTCGFGALARLGGGDFRGLIVALVMGITAYMTLSGLLAPLRLALRPSDDTFWLYNVERNLPEWLADTMGVHPGLAVLILALVLLVMVSATGAFWRSRSMAWSSVIALAIVSGWWGSTFLASQSFDPIPIESHSFTAPLGETVLYGMTSYAQVPDFSLGSVLGVIVGAFAGSVRVGQFRWEACDDPRELKRQIFGALLMGVGGVLALGCTIGQGMTAFSVLATSSLIVIPSIFVGASLGLRWLIRGAMI